MREPRGPAALVVCLLAAAACRTPAVEVPFPQGAAGTSTPPAALATAPPALNVLTVCLAEEPDTFYIYDSPNAAAQILLPAVYDGPIDVIGYEYRPVILETLPSAEAGTARVETVTLVSGDLYFNPETLLPDTLAPGKAYLPSGCDSPECVRRSEGGQIQMDRQLAEFRLLPELVWSDGMPLTAADSVFSYNLDADPRTPSLKDQVNRTASYQAIDDRTVQWTGIPGFFDLELAGNFWTPLPEHLLGGLPVQELARSEAASTAPVGWGPYILDRWSPGQTLDFVPNPNYRLRDRGLPAFDGLHVRIIGSGSNAAIQQVLTGECDLLDESLLDETALGTLQNLTEDSRLRWSAVPGVLMERLDFGTDPVDGRARILASADVRRAIAACIDRQGLTDQLAFGVSPVPSGMIAAGHPLASTGPSVAYDPAAAGESLTALGWVDEDGQSSTPRVAQGDEDVPAGTLLSLTLMTASGSAEPALAQAIADDLLQCGVQVVVEAVPAETLYAPWPDGPVFGRRFDLVAWPWLGWTSPACELFTTGEIASNSFREGSNAGGFSDAGYDNACARARLGPGTGGASSVAIQEMQTILDEEVPSLPLFQWPRLLVASDRVCGLELNPTAALLWNLEALSPGPLCAPSHE